MKQSTTETRRLFFALWPDDAVRTHLQTYQRILTDDCHGVLSGKAVARENLHLTLCFIGSTAMLELEALNRAFDNNMSAVEPFSLKLERIGVFRKPRIMWIGLRTPEPTLLQLVDYINDIVETVLPGRIARHGSFTPHVSLFRGINAIPDDAPDEVVAWRVSDFTLVESIPNICGVEYRVLRHWMLEQQGPGA